MKEKVYKVGLDTTLQGSGVVYNRGASFTGTLEDLPKDIADAVKLRKSYVNVVEVPVELVNEETAPEKTAEDVQISTDSSSPPPTTKEVKKPVKRRPRSSKKLVPKE